MDEGFQVVSVEDSILNSTKKRMGIPPESMEFDVDIIMAINAAIATLRQIGVGPQDSLFQIQDEKQTYKDYLGDMDSLEPHVKMYLLYKTRFSFDPPQSSLVSEVMRQMLSEIEWRLQFEVERPEHIEGSVIS